MNSHQAQSPLLTDLKPSDPEFTLAIQAKEAASSALLQARRRYWDHVRAHGCRERGLSAVPGPQDPSRAGEDALWRRLQEAKRNLDVAYDSVDEVRQEKVSGSLQGSDGAYALRSVLRAQESALNSYLEALKELKTALSKSSAAEGSASREASPKLAEKRGVRPLTQRECEVLAHIALGKSSREIAALLGIAFKTVVVHRHHIQTKLDVHNTADLTRVALRMGLIEP